MRIRRAWSRVAALTPAVVYLGIDVVARAHRYPAMLRLDAVSLVTTWTASALVWSLLMVAASRRRGISLWLARGTLALFAVLAVLQLGVDRHFGSYVDHGILRSSLLLEGAHALIRPFVPTIVRWALPAAIGSVAWAYGVGRIARPRRSSARRAFACALGVMMLATATTSYIPRSPQDAAPDMLALGAVGRLVLQPPTRSADAFTWQKEVPFKRNVAPVPRVHRSADRNVLFVLTESIRASAFCSAHTSSCPQNPFSNEAAPNRLPLQRMRAVGSFTLLSFAVIFTGMTVTAPKADWVTAPLLFDYAHAGDITTAHWSAQHPAFASSHAWTDGEPLDRLAWATDFDPKADEVLGADDDVVVDRAIAELPELREPFFAVVHYAGTHFPYRVDEADTPFEPLSAKLDRRDPEPLLNRYYDAIHRQDKSTAKLVRALRNMPAGARTIVVFVSDHGESFYEHDAVLHGTSLWDQELRVPMWIDAPEGTLTAAERASLEALRDVPVTHVDLAPTILDMLGLHEMPEWTRFTAKMPGQSLLRSPARDRVTTIATCNDLWSCFVPTQGKLIGDHKWLSRPAYPTFGCFDTRADPDEEHDLGPAACGQ